MAYSRWISLLPEPTEAQLDAYLDLYARAGSPLEWVESYGERIDEWCRANGFVRADHYIYWDAGSGDKCEDQLLCIHYCGPWARTRITLAQARNALDGDDWSCVPGYTECGEVQRANVRACVGQWIADVVAKYPAPPAPETGG